MTIDSPPDAETVYQIATANRLLAADMFARPVLDFLVSKPAAKGFIPRGRLSGLRFVATDQDWRHGDGPEIIGSSEAVAMAVSGRPAALDDLAGPGLDVLRRRIAPFSPAAL